MKRKKTKKIYFGEVAVGGGAPVSVQSMTDTKTCDIMKTANQINELTAAGCELVRVAVPDIEAAKCLQEIKKAITIPLIADIHFDYRLALKAVEQGVDGLRLNPGNIGSKERVSKVVKRCKNKGIPIRIGVNSGSIEKEILKKYGGPTAAGMVESALKHVEILEDNDFREIVISLKSTDLWMTIKAYEMIAARVDYPLHIGITEAGPPWRGTIKSAAGIGSLLSRGLGDTLRVSLTGDPIEEVRVGWQILQAFSLRQRSPEIISCPGCGRTSINLADLADSVENAVKDLDIPIKIAVMGCAVNGPGEAREADIGIAGGKGEGAIFKKGKLIRKVAEDQLLQELMKEISIMQNKNEKININQGDDANENV